MSDDEESLEAGKFESTEESQKSEVRSQKFEEEDNSATKILLLMSSNGSKNLNMPRQKRMKSGG